MKYALIYLLAVAIGYAIAFYLIAKDGKKGEENEAG